MVVDVDVVNCLLGNVLALGKSTEKRFQIHAEKNVFT